MALRRDLHYPGRYISATSQQPQGAFKNRTTAQSQDGSYFNADFLNDWSALFSSILTDAGVTPNGTIDQVGASQYFDALMSLAVKPNTLANSDLTFANMINQRQVADWAGVAIGDYGPDRWKKATSSTIVQPIESGNFIPNGDYVLSWNNGADFRQIVAPTSGNWESSDLEIPISATGGAKLELGKSKTIWIPEDQQVDLAKCQRYARLLNLNNYLLGLNGDPANPTVFELVAQTVTFPQMRIRPSAVVTGYNGNAVNPVTVGIARFDSQAITNSNFLTATTSPDCVNLFFESVSLTGVGSIGTGDPVRISTTPINNSTGIRILLDAEI